MSWQINCMIISGLNMAMIRVTNEVRNDGKKNIAEFLANYLESF